MLEYLPVPPSLAYLVAALDESTRSILVADANWYLHLLEWATGVLLFGVILEEVSGHLPVRHRIDPHWGIPRARFRADVWISKAKILGVVIVVAGLAGEGFAEHFDSRANDIVVDFDNALITGSQIQAAAAVERADELNKNLLATRTELLTKQTELSKQQEETARAKGRH